MEGFRDIDDHLSVGPDIIKLGTGNVATSENVLVVMGIFLQFCCYRFDHYIEFDSCCVG